MYLIRLLLLSLSFSILVVSQPSADINSWVDQNGVRHFSNTDGPGKSISVETEEEYEPNPSNADANLTPKRNYRSKDIRMYQEKERMDKIIEKEMREHDEKIKRRQKMLDKQAIEREKSCQKRKIKLEKLQRQGWKNFNSLSGFQISCPDRTWMQNGRVFDNMTECTARKNRYRKAAYEKAISSIEYEIKMFCSH